MNGYNTKEAIEDELIESADEAKNTKHFSHELKFYLDGYELSKSQQIKILRRTIKLVALSKGRDQMTKWMLTFDAVLDDGTQAITRITVHMSGDMLDKLNSSKNYPFYSFFFDDGTPFIVPKDSIIQLVYISEG